MPQTSREYGMLVRIRKPADRAEIIRIINETIMETARGDPGPLSGRLLDAIEVAGYRVVTDEAPASGGGGFFFAENGPQLAY